MWLRLPQTFSREKPNGTTLIIIDFGCGTKHVQCECWLEGILLLQGNEWDQTAFGSRYTRVSLLYALHLHANLSDDAGLIEMLTHKVRLLPVETDEHSQEHDPVRPWLSPRPFNTVALGATSN